MLVIGRRGDRHAADRPDPVRPHYAIDERDHGFERRSSVAIKRSVIKALPKGLRGLAEPVERALSQVRAWFEHPFHVVKNLFRHKKLRYRGLAKNTARLCTLFALANLVIVKQSLLATQA